MKVGGPAESFVIAHTTAELLDLIRSPGAEASPGLLLIGGGSNLVVGDSGWSGRTVQIRSSGLTIDGATVTADAGLDWDMIVTESLAAGPSGLEALSGIPGSVGASPVQNVGAFGTLTSDVLSAVDVFDRASGEIERWGPERCGFGSHRQSTFKHTDRYVMLSVSYQLRRSRQSAPIEYDSLADQLCIPKGGTASLSDVRTAVLQLRRKKGSIYDPTDPDTWGTGSFFINPVIAEVPPRAAELGCPTYPDPLDVKLPGSSQLRVELWARRSMGEGRGLPKMEVPTPPTGKTSTCSTLLSRPLISTASAGWIVSVCR